MNYREEGMHVLTANRLKPGVDPKAPGKAVPPHPQRLKERIAGVRVVQAESRAASANGGFKSGKY